MGNSLELGPFAIVIIALTMWSGRWSIPGAFFAAPITTIMTIDFPEPQGTRPIAALLSRSRRI